MTARTHPPLPIADRGLVIKFSTIGVWAVLFAAFLPVAYRGALSSALIVLLTACTVVGVAIAIVGLLRHDNLVTEVAGLCLALAGPVGYLVLVGVLGVAQALDGSTDRIALIALAGLQVEVIATRLAFLVTRRREVKADTVPEAGAR